MYKLASYLAMGVFALLALATPGMAAEGGSFSVNFGASVGVGLTVIGAAFGIGKLAASAYENMARQPEVAPAINTAMIIAAALIEGFTLFALVIFFMGIKGE